MDMAPEESLEQMVQEGVEERKRQLRRHKLPEKATLASMLTAMTKAELDDIRFNLNVTGASSSRRRSSSSASARPSRPLRSAG